MPGIRTKHAFVKILLGVFLVGGVLGGGSMTMAGQPSLGPTGEPYGSVSNNITTPTSDANVSDTEVKFASLLEMVLKVLFLLLWPLLAVAGASLDNTLVYGDVFHLTRVLFQFRQMMRTFANYALGFIFLISILISFIGASESLKKFSVKEVIKKLFLAGILINMSWFIIALLIDLSTVLVFSVGALPLHVVRQDVEEDQGVGKARYLGLHSFYNMDSSTNTQRDQLEHSIVYSCPGPELVEMGPNLPNAGQRTYYLPCRIEANKFVPQGSKTDPGTRDAYKQQYIDAWKGTSQDKQADLESHISNDYCVRGYDLIQAKHGQEFPKGDEFNSLREAGREELKAQACPSLDILIEKAKGMTGPLYTLFASIMNMGEVGVTVNNKSVTEASLEFLMRAIVAIALFLPLVALAAVLVIRAVILWLVIAFAPLLVLVYVFGFGKSAAGPLGELKELIGLIFLPVFAVFTVSISILFLSLIGRVEMIKNENSCETDLMTAISGAEIVNKADCEANKAKCYDLFGITEICFTESQRNTGANIINSFTWLATNFFGIALMRTIIFAALKSTKITASIAGKIESFGKGLMTSTPIVPLFGGTSIGALSQAGKHIGGIPGSIINKQYERGLGQQIEAWGARGDAEATEKSLATKLQGASEGKVQFSKDGSEFKNLPDDTNYTQYKSMGPALAMGAGHTYDQAKNMKFEDVQGDAKTIRYMQQNGLYNTGTFVKNGGDMGNRKKKDLGKTMEEGHKKAGGVSLGKDNVPGNEGATRYILGDYVTRFPRKNSSKDELLGDIQTYKVPAAPTKKEDWDEFQKLFSGDGFGIRENPEFEGAFAGYVTKIKEAANAPTGTATWEDKSDPDASKHKTYTIVTKDANGNIIKNASGGIAGFEIK